MNKLLKVKCPQCANVFLYYQSEFRPFCSEKCKMIDLGHWFEETYTIPVKTLPEGESENQNEIKDSSESENENEEYSN